MYYAVTMQVRQCRGHLAKDIHRGGIVQDMTPYNFFEISSAYPFHYHIRRAIGAESVIHAYDGRMMASCDIITLADKAFAQFCHHIYIGQVVHNEHPGGRIAATEIRGEHLLDSKDITLYIICRIRYAESTCPEYAPYGVYMVVGAVQRRTLGKCIIVIKHCVSIR